MKHLAVAIAAILLGCGSDASQQPPRSDPQGESPAIQKDQMPIGAIGVGDARGAILTKFGEPLHVQTVENREDSLPMYGPLATFWHKVPIGSSVEIWQYRAQGGFVELYFVDGSETVSAVAFDAHDPTGG